MRYEFKYIVDKKYLEPLRQMILPFVEMDSNVEEAEGRVHYTVRSIYFDTPAFDFYFEKIEGIKNRKKVRLRGYDEGAPEDVVFLEIKRKYEIPILKYRAPVRYKDAIAMFKERNINGHTLKKYGIHNSLENATRFFYQVYGKNLRPVVLVVYEREAYFSKFDRTVRITFDKGLRGMAYPSLQDLFDERKLSVAMKNNFILEVKFNKHFPMWLGPILSKYSLKRQSASKYTITMDSVKVIKSISKSTIYTRSKWDN
ncbi:MAG: polyphosphate polymerase domain-containing protein [Bacteroidetes bacterium]|nr:polyphosphate polymerase domain-containing protein [Bacteroidota bacterium]